MRHYEALRMRFPTMDDTEFRTAFDELEHRYANAGEAELEGEYVKWLREAVYRGIVPASSVCPTVLR